MFTPKPAESQTLRWHTQPQQSCGVYRLRLIKPISTPQPQSPLSPPALPPHPRACTQPPAPRLAPRTPPQPESWDSYSMVSQSSTGRLILEIFFAASGVLVCIGRMMSSSSLSIMHTAVDSFRQRGSLILGYLKGA